MLYHRSRPTHRYYVRKPHTRECEKMTKPSQGRWVNPRGVIIIVTIKVKKTTRSNIIPLTVVHICRIVLYGVRMFRIVLYQWYTYV